MPVQPPTSLRTGWRMRVEELRGRHVLRVFRRVREQPPQIAIVEARIVDAVVAALAPIVLAQRLAQRVQRIDLLRASPAAACGRSATASA